MLLCQIPVCLLKMQLYVETIHQTCVNTTKYITTLTGLHKVLLNECLKLHTWFLHVKTDNICESLNPVSQHFIQNVVIQALIVSALMVLTTDLSL